MKRIASAALCATETSHADSNVELRCRIAIEWIVLLLIREFEGIQLQKVQRKAGSDCSAWILL